MVKSLQKLLFIIIVLASAKSHACTPYGVPTVTGSVSGTNLTITVNSTTTWGCTYVYQGEIVCQAGAYTGTPDFTSPGTISGGPGAYAPLVIDISGYCPGTYKLRVREKVSTYGAGGPWSAWSADFVFTVAGPTLTVTAAASPASICFPGSSTLTATPSAACGGGITYTWTPGGLTGSSVSVSPAGTTTYTVTAYDPNSCVTATADVTVTAAPAVVPGVASLSPDPICSGDNVTLSIVGEVGTVQWQSAPTAAGPWTNIPGATTNPYTHGPLTAGDNLFFQAVVTSCGSDVTNVVTVTIDEPPTTATAGPDQTLCDGTTATLAGNAITVGTGTWTVTAGGGSVTSPSNPTSGVTGLTPGVNTFTWTSSNGVCPPTSDDITITVVSSVSAGPDNTATICNTGGAFDVNTLLGGGVDPGTWAEITVPPSGTFTAGTGSFDPSAASGVYTFEYTATAPAPCVDDVAMFTVTVNEEPTAGLDNSADICNTAGSTVNLNTLLSGADGGGSWAETTASGAFNPATGVLTTGGLAAGVYSFTYTVTGAVPCPDDVANFTITVQQEPFAGADNSSVLCNTPGSTLDMNTLLAGADAGGAWVETTASGAFNVVTGVFDASGLTPGAYSFTYTVTGIAPCVDDVSNFTITVTDLPTAGLDNSTDICNSAGSSVNLNTLLSGADPGTWSEVTASGSFNPATGVLTTGGLAAGVYTFNYNVAAAGPCPGDVAVFTVTVAQEVNAGADNSTSICNLAGSTVDLNTLLSPDADAGGTWAETTASGAFTPATGVLNTAGLAAGVYSFTYTMTTTPPCTDDVANFTVTVQQEVFAGTDNTTQACNNPGTTVDLNTLLSGADLGGTWTELTSSGAFSPGTGILNASGLAGGVYTFKYTVSGVAPCPNDDASFSVTVDPMPVMDVLDDEDMCEGDSHTPQVFGSDIAGSTFAWNNTSGTDIGFGFSGSGNIGTYIGSSGTTSDLTISVMVVPTSPAGCVGDPITYDVTVHPLPVPAFVPNVTQGCAPLNVIFTNSTIGADECLWDFGNGVTATGCASVSNTYNLPGLYDVSLTTTTIYGCTASVTYPELISVSPVPKALFGYNPQFITVENTEVDFINTSVNADEYKWLFNDGSPSSTDENPTHFFPTEAGEYLVQLIAMNSDGACRDTTERLITIQDIIIFYVPNIFTPDGDQYNEFFQPKFFSGYDPYDFHMTIFNRWGEIVFETFNADKGWDGTYGDKGLVKDDTYIWFIEFKETNSDKLHKHRGHVTILK